MRAMTEGGTRERILEVALGLFERQGYAGTSLRDISDQLGVTKAALYYHFPSKEELFTAVVDQATTAFREQLSETLNPHGEIVPALRGFGLRLLEKIIMPDAISLHRLIVAEAGRFPELGRIFYERAPRLTVALLADFLAGAMERGQLRSDSPTDAAYFLMQMCMSRCQQKLLLALTNRVSDNEIADEVDRALNLFMCVYAPGATGRLHTD